MKPISILSLGLMLSSMIGCGVLEPNEIVEGTGPILSRSVEVEPFNRISTTGTAQLNVTVGDAFSVTLNAQEEILDVMEQQVASGTLILDFKDNVNIRTSKDISIDITLPILNGVSSEGTGDIYLSGPLQDHLDVEMQGTGDLRAMGLQVRDCSITLTGTGDAYIHVHDRLEADMTGTGNIYYQGSPAIELHMSGTGNLISYNAHPRLTKPIKPNITI